jgi:shikimate kinase
MKLFLAGVGCVGKTAVGACLAGRLGCAFYDLDLEIERYFGKPIQRLRDTTLTPYTFRRKFASIVLAKLIESEQNGSFVMALPPSGLMDCMWRILKQMDRIVVALRDSPENILSRITFYDADSEPLVKTLNDRERLHHLREIRKDAAYFGRSFVRADLMVDINGLDVEASAAKIENLLRERSLGPFISYAGGS